MLVKLLLMDDLSASIDVRVPTKEVMPIVIIKTVSVVRKSWLLIARKDIFIFSLKTEAIVTF